MNLSFCKLKKAQKHEFHFLKPQKKLKKHEFHFLQATEPQKTWISFFCKLKKLQRTWISCFASLKKLPKHEFHFLHAKKPQKTWISFFARYSEGFLASGLFREHQIMSINRAWGGVFSTPPPESYHPVKHWYALTSVEHFLCFFHHFCRSFVTVLRIEN